MDYLYSMGYSFIIAAFFTVALTSYLVEHEWW
jgi:hypothetical protein